MRFATYLPMFGVGFVSFCMWRFMSAMKCGNCGSRNLRDVDNDWYGNIVWKCKRCGWMTKEER